MKSVMIALAAVTALAGVLTTAASANEMGHRHHVRHHMVSAERLHLKRVDHHHAWVRHHKHAHRHAHR